MTLAIGIDLGGTAIKGGLVDESGEVLHRTSIATNAVEGVDAVINRIADFANTLSDHAASRHSRPVGIGVGAPGTMRLPEGVILSAPNLPGWSHVEFVPRLKRLVTLPVVLNNDANAAALGESVCGAGRGVRDMLMLTLGTGVGGGIIIGGRLLRGERGNAGELGHIIVQPGGLPCNCGQAGCLEAHASASATGRLAMQRLAAGECSTLQSILDRNGHVTSADVAAAAQSGDSLAASVWSETCRYLAIACIGLRHTFDPQCIVLAGGMSEAGDFLISGVNDAIHALISPRLGPPPELRLAQLGNDAGFVGAAMTVFQKE
ncbi:MAG: ROK family protein [Phycisphaerae bacterium]|nr:ROK family protein [Phycisphaerae bacterium]